MIQLGEIGETVNLDSIYVGEALEDGSFTYTDGENPSVTLRLIVRGAVDAYPAYLAVIRFLSKNYRSDNGVLSSYNIPLDNIQISSTGSLYAYRADCTFQYPSDNGSNGNGNKGTTPNNPSINNADYQMPEIQDSDFQYSTVGGTEHITHGYASIQYMPSVPDGQYNTVQFGATYGGTANVPKDFIDYGTGIQWNNEQFEGVDVVAPNVSFSIAISAPNTWITESYRQLITQATGSINAYPYVGYDSHCVLFKGITASTVILNYTDPDGNAVKDWYWRLRYEFEARPVTNIPFPPNAQKYGSNNDKGPCWFMSSFDYVNSQIEALDAQYQAATDPDVKAAIELEIDAIIDTVEDGFTTIQKPGYDYIWYKTEKQLTDSGSEMPIEPILKQASVVQVYPEFDFSLLGLVFPTATTVTE